MPYAGPIANAIENDVENDVERLATDVYPDFRDDLKNAKWYDYLYYFRWVFNFLFVGMPWFVFSIVMVVVNIVLNILMNKWWAGGNFLLIFNTWYLVSQTILSWPLVFEIPIFLNKMRFVRLFSVLWSWIYNAVYIFILVDWIYQIWLVPNKDYEEYQFFDILVNMFLAYNIVFHLHVIPVNFVIIVKEFFLEVFPPLLKQDVGENLDM